MTANEPARKPLALLAHSLSNSSTVLYGILDQLQTLESRTPQMVRMVSDLAKATDQIQEVRESLVAMARSSGSEDKRVEPKPG